MRLVPGPGDLADAVTSAQREAAAAFGSDEVFLERYLAAPRHVEVQVFGDTWGTVLHLYDRECSVQRRHQKVLEEAPAVLVPDATRRRMWDAAVAAAQVVDYVGAGTVEYLVDGTGFYFLEMNTRLQVEHGVTELVTGLDLVGLQLAVASGLPLPFGQAEVSVTGHAVEVRLCAERPREDYRPTPGTVSHVSLARGSGPAHRQRHRVGQRRQPRLRLAGGEAHGPRRGPRRGHRPAVAWPCARSSSTASRPTVTCSAAVLDDEAFRRGEADIHYLEQPPRPARRDAARRGAAAPRRRGGVPPDRRAGGPQPGPGARGRVAQRRPRAPRRPAAPTRAAHWWCAPPCPTSPPTCSSTGRGRPWARPPPGTAWSTWWRRTGCGGATASGCTAHARRRQRPRGPVELRPAHRGRSRRARRHRRRVPGPPARSRHQGPRRRRRHRGRGRRAGRPRGDEDGAHPAGQRRRDRGAGPVRAGPAGRRATISWSPWSPHEHSAGPTAGRAARGELQRVLRGPPERGPRDGRGRAASTSSPATGWPS